MGGLQPPISIILAGRPGMGKTALATNIAYNVAKAWSGEVSRRRPHGDGQRRHRRLLLAGNVGRAARHPDHLRADRNTVEQDSPRRDRRSAILRRSRTSRSNCRTCRSMSTKPAALSIGATCGPRATAQAAARPRSTRDRLYPAAAGLDPPLQRKRVQEVTEITTRLKALAKELNVPILALSQLSRQVENREDKRRNFPTCVSPARSNRTPTWSCSSSARNIITRCASRPRRTGKNSPNGWPKASASRARPKSSSANSATARQGRSNCSSRRPSPASPIWRPRIASAEFLGPRSALYRRRGPVITRPWRVRKP